MLRTALLAGLLSAGLALPQTKMSVDQLVGFVRSSKKLGYTDKQVAEFLKQVKLASQLEDRTIEDLQGTGAGPRTLEALRGLRASSLLLPVAAPEQKVVIAPLAPPDSLEQARILDQTRQYAMGYTRQLPDFICTQVTRRYVDPSGMEFWHHVDTVVAKLSYTDRREDYKVVLVNNQVVNTSMDQLGGSTSSGEFGSLMRELFEPETQARLEWERWATLRGRRMHVFSYIVDQSRSKWHILYQRQEQITPGYKGLVYVDKETGAVARITLEADHMPPSFPVQMANTILDYDSANISGRDFVLPLKAVVRMRSGKYLTKNDVEFRGYRKFSTDVNISFDTPEPIPDEKLKEQPPNNK